MHERDGVVGVLPLEYGALQRPLAVRRRMACLRAGTHIVDVVRGKGSYQVCLEILNSNVSLFVYRIGTVPVPDTVSLAILHPTDPSKSVDRRLCGSNWPSHGGRGFPNFMTEAELEELSRDGKFVVHVNVHVN